MCLGSLSGLAYLDSGAALHIQTEMLHDIHSDSNTVLNNNASDASSEYSDMYPDFQMDEEDDEEPA